MLIHDLTPTCPDYHGASIVNLMRSLGDGLGAPGNGYAPLDALDARRVRAARRVILVVIDGLGAELLAYVGPNSALAGLTAGRMTSVYPPTTASAITTFMTGLAPQQHGLTGWFMHFREVGSVLAILPFMPRCARVPLAAAGIPLAALVDSPSFASTLSVPAAALLPREIADSPFSQLLGAGATRLPYAGVDEFGASLAELCRGAGGYGHVYAYWSELDSLSHLHGPSSRSVAEHFAALDAALAPLADIAARHGSLLVITADHGFIDTGPAERIDIEDHPALAATLSQPLCGEPRSAWCYVQAAQAARFEREAEAALGEHAEIVASADLIDRGWFGLGQPHAELGRRIGDYALIMRGRDTVRDRVAGERNLRLAGVHGGISAAEQYVPLLLAGP